MAHDSPEKKRKRASEKNGRPSKKAAISQLKVEFVHNQDGPAPVIGMGSFLLGFIFKLGYIC